MTNTSAPKGTVPNPMIPERKQAWVQALLSGDYDQARNEFVMASEPIDEGPERRTHYCCLAVLTDLAAKDPASGVRWSTVNPSAQDQYLSDELARKLGYNRSQCNELDHPEPSSYSAAGWYRYDDGDLSNRVREWAGWGPTGPSDPRLDGATAIQRNDENEDSFEEIARAIEEDPAL